MKRAADDIQVAGPVERTAATVLLWLLGALTVVPLLLILAKALEPDGGGGGGLTLDNVRRAWNDGQLGDALLTSAGVTSLIVLFSTVLSIVAGYAIAVVRPLGARILFVLFVLGLLVPFEALVIPLYYRLQDVGLTNTYWALVFPQSALSLSFGIYWMRSFFLGIPRSLLEAARVEGATPLRTLWSIVLPMGRPAIGTLVLLSFMWNWNEFLMPLVMISSEDRRTAPLALAQFQSRYTVDVSAQAAAAIIIAAPILVLYVLLHRRFMAGFTGDQGRS